jgi:phosphate transport system substrate-binding protein
MLSQASQLGRRTRIAVRGAIIATTLILSSASGWGQAARDYISIVGSSTVFPFATVVAERFGRNTRFRTPTIESTGSGGGFRLFCGGIGVQYPDITNASRRIRKSEVDDCASKGIDEIVEVKIGYDGIVVANVRTSVAFALTRRHLYLGLAKTVPDPAGGDHLVANPYERWSEIDPSLPDFEIEVLGPPPTSGTRDAFLELAMEPGCRTFPRLLALEEAEFEIACYTMREDGGYIEAGENDNLIVQKLQENPTQLGIFGFSFLDQNSDKVRGSKIDDVAPTFESISDGTYPISRPLYFYVKKAHTDVIPGIREFLEEFTSDEAWGDFGYLSDRGLIPLAEDERVKIAALAQSLTPLKL